MPAAFYVLNMSELPTYAALAAMTDEVLGAKVDIYPATGLGQNEIGGRVHVKISGSPSLARVGEVLRKKILQLKAS